MSVEELVTDADRLTCFVRGHDVHGWGTICGWCRRCQHSVWTYDGKSVLSHGEWHSYPPAHTPEGEASLRELGYTRHGVPAPCEEDAGFTFSRSDALALHGHEDDFLKARGVL